MSKRPRRNHLPLFKAKVVIDAIKGREDAGPFGTGATSIAAAPQLRTVEVPASRAPSQVGRAPWARRNQCRQAAGRMPHAVGVSLPVAS